MHPIERRRTEGTDDASLHHRKAAAAPWPAEGEGEWSAEGEGEEFVATFIWVYMVRNDMTVIQITQSL